MSLALLAWEALLATTAVAFTRPAFALFHELLCGWVLCPSRRTITGIICVADPEFHHAHDAYHRLLRVGRWSMALLWRILAAQLVAALAPDGTLPLGVDDTLFHKFGRQINGAGIFRDPVRSTKKKVVYTLGLNLVVLTLRVVPPWKGEPLGLPVNLRLYRKGGPSHLELAGQMMRELATWFPERYFALVGDSAYASLARSDLPRTHITSRMRRDAALYDLPPARRPGQRGRPRKRGRPLLSLPLLTNEMTTDLRPGFAWTIVDIRGKLVHRLLLHRTVLWYAVCPDRPVLLIIVRDPDRVERDDFFFTTDLSMTPAQVVNHYAGRWSTEDTFRNAKQFLGGQQPQSWKHQGPERAAALSFWLYSAVWLWYMKTNATAISWPSLPWYPAKRTPSFLDALAALRRPLWRSRLFASAARRPLPTKTTNALIDILARAA